MLTSSVYICLCRDNTVAEVINFAETANSQRKIFLLNPVALSMSATGLNTYMYKTDLYNCSALMRYKNKDQAVKLCLNFNLVH